MHPESYLFFDETDVKIWEETRPAVLTGSEVVEIWRIHLPSFRDHMAELLQMLQPDEKNKAALFVREKDKHRFIIGRAMLRMLLGEYLNLNPKALSFTYGTFAKPVLKIGKDIPVHFNVSHSGDYILIAVGQESVGVDVEQCQTNLDIADMMEAAFVEKEVSFMKKQASPSYTFFSLWTRKEALLKASSTGIHTNMRYVPCLNGKHTIPSALLNNSQHWRISNFKVDDQHVGSTAYLTSTREIRFRQILTCIC